jgi:hypothetical protein
MYVCIYRFHFQNGQGEYIADAAYWDVFPLNCNYFDNKYDLHFLDDNIIESNSGSNIPQFPPLYFPNGLTGNRSGVEVDAAILCSDTGTISINKQIKVFLMR